MAKSPQVIRQASLAALFFLLAPLAARAQTVPSLAAPAHLSAFGNFTYGYSDWAPQAIYGYTIGGDFQTAHLWGIETRGSMLRWGAESAEESALAGPRVVYHRGRFIPYVVMLGGGGHVRYQSGPGPTYNRATTGVEWEAVGGVDFYMSPRMQLRLGEYSYSKIYVLKHGLTPTNYSAGIVFRIR